MAPHQTGNGFMPTLNDAVFKQSLLGVLRTARPKPATPGQHKSAPLVTRDGGNEYVNN
jgi:hypothetical protein